MQGRCLLRLGVACAVLAALACPTARAYCGAQGTAKDSCRNITVPNPTRTLICDVGKLQGTAMKYAPTDTNDKRFAAANYRESCLGNAGQPCSHISNTLDVNSPDDLTSCCSCYLYAHTCYPNQKGGDFVMDKTFTAATKHALLLPTKPCTGVDNWANQNSANKCPTDKNGELIWDEAQDKLDSVGKDATWGMAINPVSRRGQHQMHIHLAQIYESLALTLDYAHNAAKLKNFRLDCDLANRKLLAACRILPCDIMPNNTHPQVFITTDIKNPSGARPFRNVYTDNPTSSVPNVLTASLLVVRVPNTKDTWAKIINNAGPAECFFKPNGDQDLTKACNETPKATKFSAAAAAVEYGQRDADAGGVQAVSMPLVPTDVTVSPIEAAGASLVTPADVSFATPAEAPAVVVETAVAETSAVQQPASDVPADVAQAQAAATGADASVVVVQPGGLRRLQGPGATTKFA